MGDFNIDIGLLYGKHDKLETFYTRLTYNL